MALLKLKRVIPPLYRCKISQHSSIKPFLWQRGSFRKEIHHTRLLSTTTTSRDLASVSASAEPTFQSLGLGSWWPSGQLQSLLEAIHVGLDVPWWGSILIVGGLLRLCVFPLLVVAQKNVAKLNNHLPGMEDLQQKMITARESGDVYAAEAVSMELREYMQKHEVNPLKSLLPIFAQVPIFASMFFGLRGMCNVPVPSMTQGGLAWFPDLTVADPLYILPVFTCASLWLHLYTSSMNSEQTGFVVRGVVLASPIIILPMTITFPSAITFYWASTNVISILQSRIIKNELVRERLGIPKMIKWPKKKTKDDQPTFQEALRENYNNWKVQADAADRKAHEERLKKKAEKNKK